MEQLVQVDVTVLNFIVGALVPLLVAVLSKVNASSGLKAVLNLGLSILAGVASTLLLTDGETTFLGIATSAITVYLASGVTYQNLWKPTAVAPAVAEKTSGFGLGSNSAVAG